MRRKRIYMLILQYKRPHRGGSNGMCGRRGRTRVRPELKSPAGVRGECAAAAFEGIHGAVGFIQGLAERLVACVRNSPTEGDRQPAESAHLEIVQPLLEFGHALARPLGSL